MTHLTDRKKKMIGIIGAGVSGLLACKYCLSKGFDPIVFESESSIGGVWRKTIGSTKLQTPKIFYQFSDFPWPNSVTEMFPDQKTVLQYIESYVNHFDLLRHIQFNSKVLSISYQSDKGKWNVTVQDTPTLFTQIQVYQVDFVVVCVERFSQVANVPEFPPNNGPEAFEGEVIHSMDYSQMDPIAATNFVKGKQVAVVGFQKSGMDIAMECSTVNGHHTGTFLIFFPRGLSLGYLYLSRFSKLMVHKPGEGLLLSILATTLSPLRWALSKFVESYIKHKNRLAKHGIVPEGFYERVEEGSIKLIKKAENFVFLKEGIVLEGQAEPIESDIVILATGFKGIDKLKHICIHPRIPQLAIIGFSESIANLYTSEIRCRWLAELLDRKFKLPSVKMMEKDIAEWDKYKKRYSYRKYYRRSCITALHIWYNDRLGWNPRRKKGVWAEWFQPYGPMDYAS